MEEKNAGQENRSQEMDKLLLAMKSSQASKEDYARLLDLFDDSFSRVAEGEVVKGRVLKMQDNQAVIDIGYKSEGLVNVSEFRDEEGNPTLSAGDEVEVYVEKVDDVEGYVFLSHERAKKMKVWERIEKAHENDEPIMGTVTDRIKGGLAVDVGVRAFLPGSLVDVRSVREIESLIGQSFEMKVIKVNRRRGNIVLSRKAVLEEVNKKRKKETLQILEVGKLMKGQVKNITDYGAFIDLGGIDGLLHITDMSWGRIKHPSEILNISQEIDVVILAFELDRERVSLGYKQKTPDPWISATRKYPRGTRTRGIVVSLANYGAFVELSEGIEGLIHISEMSWTKKIKHPSQVLSVGDEAEVMVLDLDLENRRISLGLKQTEPNPWDRVAQSYSVGSVIKGKVRNLTDFGAFVEVEEGVDGLVHISDLAWDKRISHPSEVVQKGDEVEAVILSIEPENQRLSLGIKQMTPGAWQVYLEGHQVGQLVSGTVSKIADFGLFIELADGVEGLVHISEISEEHVDKPEDLYSVGDKVETKVLRVNPQERKISLSIRAVKEAGERRETASYRQASGEATASLGEIAGGLAGLKEQLEERAEAAARAEAERAKAEAAGAAEEPTESEGAEPAGEASETLKEPEAETDAAAEAPEAAGEETPEPETDAAAEAPEAAGKETPEPEAETDATAEAPDAEAEATEAETSATETSAEEASQEEAADQSETPETGSESGEEPSTEEAAPEPESSGDDPTAREGGPTEEPPGTEEAEEAPAATDETAPDDKKKT